MILFTGEGDRVRGGGGGHAWRGGGVGGLGPCVAGGCAWQGGMSGGWHAW